MEITWHKDTCFQIKGKKVTVVVNPQQPMKGDIVLKTGGEIAGVEGMIKLFDWPGEYEIKDVPISGFQAHTQSVDGKPAGDETVIYRFDVDDVSCCHLGELGHKLTNEMIDKIGNIDVLMVKIGEDSNLSKSQALDVIEAIEPRVVIPMGGHGVVAALNEWGIQGAHKEEKLSIGSRNDLPSDQLKYVVLEAA